MKRYYYKTEDGSGYLSLKSPLEDTTGYVEITEAQFNAVQPQPHEPTAAEKARAKKLSQISHLKSELAKTDYQAIKYAEGWISEEDYAEMKAQRQTYRDEINELESEL